MKKPVKRRDSPVFLYILLLVIAAAVIVLIVRHETGTTFGLDNVDFGRLTLLGVVLLFVGGGFLGRSLRPGEVLRGFAFWFLMIVAVAGVYANRDNLVGVAGRLLGAIAPGVPISGRIAGDTDPDSVLIVRASDGHFAVRATVDGVSLPLLLDTGASFVTLTYTDAREIGVDTEALDFKVPIRTANGTMNAASVVINRLAIGSIERRDVKALVAPRGALEQGLLGMSFLDTLNGYAISGDRLRLTP
jgi:aspartyl protease family protein